MLLKIGKMETAKTDEKSGLDERMRVAYEKLVDSRHMLLFSQQSMIALPVLPDCQPEADRADIRRLGHMERREF